MQRRPCRATTTAPGRVEGDPTEGASLPGREGRARAGARRAAASCGSTHCRSSQSTGSWRRCTPQKSRPGSCSRERQRGDRALARRRAAGGAWSTGCVAEPRGSRRPVAGNGCWPLPRARVPARRDVLAHVDMEGGFTLLGLVGLIDPPREEAVRAVAACHERGYPGQDDHRRPRSSPPRPSRGRSGSPDRWPCAHRRRRSTGSLTTSSPSRRRRRRCSRASRPSTSCGS